MPTCRPGCHGHKPVVTAITDKGIALTLQSFLTHTRVLPGLGLWFGPGHYSAQSRLSWCWTKTAGLAAAIWSLCSRPMGIS